MRRKTTLEQRARIAQWAAEWKAGTATVTANQVATELNLSPQLVYYHAKRVIASSSAAVPA